MGKADNWDMVTLKKIFLMPQFPITALERYILNKEWSNGEKCAEIIIVL